MGKQWKSSLHTHRSLAGMLPMALHTGRGQQHRTVDFMGQRSNPRLTRGMRTMDTWHTTTVLGILGTHMVAMVDTRSCTQNEWPTQKPLLVLRTFVSPSRSGVGMMTFYSAPTLSAASGSWRSR